MTATIQASHLFVATSYALWLAFGQTEHHSPEIKTTTGQRRFYSVLQFYTCCSLFACTVHPTGIFPQWMALEICSSLYKNRGQSPSPPQGGSVDCGTPLFCGNVFAIFAICLSMHNRAAAYM
jgi:hypothetical protein